MKISHVCARECWFMIRHIHTRSHTPTAFVVCPEVLLTYQCESKHWQGRKLLFVVNLSSLTQLTWKISAAVTSWPRANHIQISHCRQPPRRRKCHSVEIRGNWSLWCHLILILSHERCLCLHMSEDHCSCGDTATPSLNFEIIRRQSRIFVILCLLPASSSGDTAVNTGCKNKQDRQLRKTLGEINKKSIKKKHASTLTAACKQQAANKTGLEQVNSSSAPALSVVWEGHSVGFRVRLELGMRNHPAIYKSDDQINLAKVKSQSQACCVQAVKSLVLNHLHCQWALNKVDDK